MKNAPALLAVIVLEGLRLLAMPPGQSPQGGQEVDTSPHTAHAVQVNGVTLQYLDWGGEGALLVFLTGYGSPAHVFDDLAPRFTHAFRVVALTRRGRAPSDTPSSGYDLDTLAADVLAFLDALGFERAHLVAHSFGGSEATHIATVHPDRVASIVYLDAALDAAAAEAVMKDAPIPNPQPAPGTPYWQVPQWWTSYSPDFTKLRCPTLAFYAVQDEPPVPPAASEDLRKRANVYWRTRWLPVVRQIIEKYEREAPGGRAVVLDNASHYLFRDREAEVVREMSAFYDSLRR
jgi:pimeloyl-ACP methyl ester carboxylesterase